MNNYSEIQNHAFINDADEDIIQLPQFPCHTQTVERCIKLVTEASAAGSGQEQRDRFIEQE